MNGPDTSRAAQTAGSGDPAYNTNIPAADAVPSRSGVNLVGPVPPRGDAKLVGPVSPRGDAKLVGPVPSPGAPNEPPRRLRRLHRVWPDRDGNISYLLTLCVDGRASVLNNDDTFERLVAFLIDSPSRYHWFGRRFVVMPDHLHLIAHMGYDAVRLGQWIKAMKAVVGGLKPREESPVRVPGLQAPPDGTVTAAAFHACPADALAGHVPPPVGRLPSRGDLGDQAPPPSACRPGTPPTRHVTRIERAWRWQSGFHDHKFRTPEAEARKWEYICLNPVRAKLVDRPEQWPFGGEIFYHESGGPRLVRGTPPLLESGLLVEKDGTLHGGVSKPPGEGTTVSPGGGTRPTR